MMAEPPLLYLRGAVCRVKFPSDEHPETHIDKYALCLQEGRILQNRRSFVGVLLTTCKDNNQPRVPAWKVFVSPTESHTDYGVFVDCGLIFTFPMADVLDYQYTLQPDTMRKVDEALAYGVGFLKVEDLKKEQHKMTPQA